MRRRSGWPSKAIPKRSNTSRSIQFAVSHTPETVGHASPSLTPTFRRTRSFPRSKEWSQYTMSKRGSRAFQSTAVRSTRNVNVSASRRWRQASTSLSAATSTVVWPTIFFAETTAPGTAAASAATRGSPIASTGAGTGAFAGAAGFAGAAAFGAAAAGALATGVGTGAGFDAGAGVAADGAGAGGFGAPAPFFSSANGQLLRRAPHDAHLLDLLLELHEAVEESLGPRRTAGYVDVHGHDSVDALRDRVGPVRAAAGRAGAHRDDPLRFGHLVVEALDDGRHLFRHGSRHDHEVALPRRATEDFGAEARHVVAAVDDGHHLDGAARKAELHRPERVLATPSDDGVDGGREDVVRERVLDQAHERAPRRHAYTYPTTRITRKTSISTRPNSLSLWYMTAHGNRKIVSTSNTTNRTAMR